VSPVLPVTIGTASGDWAPPKLVAFELTDNLNIVNADEIRWTIQKATRIRYAAIFVRGGWYVAWSVDVPVGRGQDVVLAAREMSIDVEMPPERVSPPERPSLNPGQEQLQRGAA
jgi:hypothetical protein